MNAKTTNVVKVDYILLRIIRGYISNSTTQPLIIDHDEGLINSDEYSQGCEENCGRSHEKHSNIYKTIRRYLLLILTLSNITVSDEICFYSDEHSHGGEKKLGQMPRETF